MGNESSCPMNKKSFQVLLQREDDVIIMLSNSLLENAIAFASYLFVNSKQNLIVRDQDTLEVYVTYHIV